MGRKVITRLSKEGLNKGAWTKEEDRILKAYMNAHCEGKWSTVPKNAGLKRCGRSCRLRWLNYLKPGIKRGDITLQEEDLIIRLHNLLGNRWSLIAGRLPGRTDNEIKNYWNTVLHKKVQQARNDSSDQRAASTGTEVPELIQTIPIRLTKISNASCTRTESNITDSTGRNCSLSIEFSPEVESSNRVISGSTDTQMESLWQFMLSLDFDELTAISESHLQSDCTNVVHQLQYASDYAVPSYAGLEA